MTPTCMTAVFWKAVDHPELGRSFIYPGEAAIYNGSPWRISRRAPLIGEHNAEIFCEELGLSRGELSAAGGKPCDLVPNLVWSAALRPTCHSQRKAGYPGIATQICVPRGPRLRWDDDEGRICMSCRQQRRV